MSTESDLHRRLLVDIVQRASTLAERLQCGTRRLNVEFDPVLVQQKLETWCDVVAKGDWVAFRKRLAWDGLDLEVARTALAPLRLQKGAPLPEWADLLAETLWLNASSPNHGTDDRLADRERFLDADEPLPFEEVLVPFALVARRRLVSRVGAAYRLLSPEAHAALERNLLATLTAYARGALYLEFSLLRAQCRSTLDRLVFAVLDNHDDSLYRQFIEGLRRGGLVSFFHEYAVLARLISTVSLLWVEAKAEFIERLASDWQDLEHMFSGLGELGQVMMVRPSLSDPHRGQRTVIALSFVTGCQIVYKPKDMGIEAAYNRLLGWLNKHGAPLPFRVLRVLDRPRYGWTEFVEHLPCSNTKHVQQYYRRAGMLLCLVYALEGADCHGENLIASGEYPVLVDVETLLQHRVRQDWFDNQYSAPALASEEFAQSVLQTGMLPIWQLGPDGGMAYDVSGLGPNDEQEMPFRASRWLHVNSDRMRVDFEPWKAPAGTNLPFLNGSPVRLSEHTECLIAGFRDMYRFLLEHRNELLGLASPLHGLTMRQVRFVYRPTRVYGMLLANLLDAEYLREGTDRSIQLELLTRISIRSEGRPFCWPLVAAEQQAMEQMDVPFFSAHADSTCLDLGQGGEIEAFFVETGSDLVRGHLDFMDEHDLEQQVSFIEGTLYAQIAHKGAGTKSISAGKPIDTAAPLAPEDLVAQSLVIANELQRRAIRAADGSVAWIGPQYLATAERFQFQPLGHDLYAGVCGIALFLSAVEKITGAPGYRELALGAVEPLQRALQTNTDRLAKDLGIGGAVGLGGVIYALVRMAWLLNEPALLTSARQAAALITTQRIAMDRKLDVLGGAAGALLGLRVLYDVASDKELLSTATACGSHLLAMRRASEVGYRAWETGGGLSTGFSHGVAGIAYALLRLYEITGAAELIEAAEEAIAYETSVFSAEVGNWPDLLAADSPSFFVRWCHGAAGIGLARLGGISVLDTSQIRMDIQVAAATTQQFGIDGIDHLCCGNLGRVEMLLEIGRSLARPDLVAAAAASAAQVVARAQQTGSFAMHPSLPNGINCPGFFQGTTGIGYELLRLAYPDALPSVLSWK